MLRQLLQHYGGTIAPRGTPIRIEGSHFIDRHLTEHKSATALVKPGPVGAPVEDAEAGSSQARDCRPGAEPALLLSGRKRRCLSGTAQQDACVT